MSEVGKDERLYAAYWSDGMLYFAGKTTGSVTGEFEDCRSNAANNYDVYMLALHPGVENGGLVIRGVQSDSSKNETCLAEIDL